MNMNIQPGMMLVIASALLGCTNTVLSEYVRTSDIRASISVVADAANHAQVTVVLRSVKTTATYVDLGAGDTLTASAAGVSKELRETRSGVYEGELSIGAEVDFTVDFDRAEELDAPASTGRLPPPFEIESPVATEELSRAEHDLVVMWATTVDAPGGLLVRGPCILDHVVEVDGKAGSFTVEKHSLTEAEGHAGESCDVEIDLSFLREGQADPGLDDGSDFRAFQQRKVTIVSSP